MSIISADTSISTAAKQFALLRRMTIQQRADITFNLIGNLRKIVEAGIKSRHSDYDDQKTKLAVLKLTLGEEMFSRAFGENDIQI